MRIPAPVILLATGSLCACTAIPPLPPTRALNTPSVHQADQSLAAATADWPSQDWWLAYGDPQLDALINEALSGAPDLAMAQARVDRAQAVVGAARAATSPQVSANARYQTVKQSYNNGIPPAFTPRGYNDSAQATLDLAWDLDVFGENRAALAAATSDAQAAAVEAAGARLVLSTAIASVYGRLAELFADRDAIEAALAIREQTVALTDERIVNGLENRGAGEGARSRLAATRGDRAFIGEEIALTRDRLAALVGAGPDRGASLTRPQAQALKTFGLPANLKVDLIGRRPDLVAARLRAESQLQRVRQARARFYPDIDLAAYFGQQSLGLDLFTRGGSRVGAVGPALHLPIFQGGALRANYQGASADYDGAVASYNATLVRALQDVADVAVSSRALAARLMHAREALAASTGAHEIALQRYRGGLSTHLEVLVAEDAMIADQRVLSSLESRAFTLDVALVRALGGGFHSA